VSWKFGGIQEWKWNLKPFQTVNECEHVKTGKAHFQTYVPMPEVRQNP
jgi:hypothetical protein